MEAGNHGSVARSACSTLPVSTSTTRAGVAAEARPAAQVATRTVKRRRARLTAMRMGSVDRNLTIRAGSAPGPQVHSCVGPNARLWFSLLCAGALYRHPWQQHG